MKYYKLINSGWGVLEKGKIYPEDHKNTGGDNSIDFYASKGIFRNDWIEVPEYEYYLQEGLPEKWAIYRTIENCKDINEWNNKQLRNGESYRCFANHSGEGDYFYSDASHTGTIREGYTEISFDTFKKLVLKHNDMKDREIIGYKLKEDCENYAEAVADIAFIYSYKSNRTIKEINKVISTSSICKEHLEKAGVLNLWFDAVYAEEYKVGDWVVVKSIDQGGSGNGIFTDNLIAQLCVKDISNATGILSENADFSVKNKSKYYNIKKTHIQRKATPEEVKAAQYPQIEVNGYKGEFFDDYVKFGCAKIEKEYILKINDILSNTY